MSHELPSGSVTLLFTDIEGSTRLLNELGAEAYEEALADHRRLLREAFARHGGVEVDTQGDAFFYAFPSGPEAIEAAGEGQRALSVGPIRVRMGLHTGRPHVGREGYVGEDVHLAARIAAAGHGGQVLVSQATRALVDGGLADLGEHRVKDFSEPVWIFQLGERALSAAENDLEHESAAAGVVVRGPGAGGVGRGRAAAGWRAAGDAVGPGRFGEDAAGDRVGGRSRSGVQERRLLDRPREPARSDPRCRDCRADVGGQGRPGRAHRRARAAPAAGQLRASGGGRSGAPFAARVLPEPSAFGHEPGAVACPGRGRVSGGAAGGVGGGRALLRPFPARAERRHRGALPPARQPAARGRARRRPHERPFSRPDPGAARASASIS